MDSDENDIEPDTDEEQISIISYNENGTDSNVGDEILSIVSNNESDTDSVVVSAMHIAAGIFCTQQKVK